jgi:GT2 family glycosyltransferase
VPDDVRTEPVEAVSGACMYLPRALFERVGGFDEGYFLHCEDLDLCRRVRDAGALVAVVHSAQVRHAQGSSSWHRPVFVSRHKHRGMWRWFVRHDPAARNPLLRLLVGAAIGAHFLATAPYLWLRARVRG